ncbi:hypothetical protein ACTL6U_16235 [Rhodovibrionaceae bacterium A322]
MAEKTTLSARDDKPTEPVTKCNEPFGVNGAARKLVDDCKKVTEEDREELRQKARKSAREVAEEECALHKKCNVTHLLSDTKKFTETCDNRVLVISLNVDAVCKESEEKN